MDEETPARVGLYIQDVIQDAIDSDHRQTLEDQMQDYASLVADRLGFDHGRAFEVESGIWKILLSERAVVIDFSMPIDDTSEDA